MFHNSSVKVQLFLLLSFPWNYELERRDYCPALFELYLSLYKRNCNLKHWLNRVRVMLFLLVKMCEVPILSKYITLWVMLLTDLKSCRCHKIALSLLVDFRLLWHKILLSRTREKRPQYLNEVNLQISFVMECELRWSLVITTKQSSLIAAGSSLQIMIANL